MPCLLQYPPALELESLTMSQKIQAIESRLFVSNDDPGVNSPVILTGTPAVHCGTYPLLVS